LPSLLPTRRWALTPPFHPYLRANLRRCPAGFPAGCHRVAQHRRYILCGTVRNAMFGRAVKLGCAKRPLALPGALPFTLRPERLKGSSPPSQPSTQSYCSACAEWCPDFPPALAACAASASAGTIPGVSPGAMERPGNRNLQRVPGTGGRCVALGSPGSRTNRMASPGNWVNRTGSLDNRANRNSEAGRPVDLVR